jgi:hypothetical protein
MMNSIRRLASLAVCFPTAVCVSGAVQRSRFSDGTEVVVNFGEQPYAAKVGGKRYLLPKNGFAAKGPKIEQSFAPGCHPKPSPACDGLRQALSRVRLVADKDAPKPSRAQAPQLVRRSFPSVRRRPTAAPATLAAVLGVPLLPVRPSIAPTAAVPDPAPESGTTRSRIFRAAHLSDLVAVS